MGCFLGCFGASKDDKNRHRNSHIAHVPHPNPNYRKQYSPVHQIVTPKQDLLVEPINPPILETRVKPEEKNLSLTSNQEKQVDTLHLGAQKKVTFDANVKEYKHVPCEETPEILEENEKGADCTKIAKSSSLSESGSSLSSLGSFPPNHRYQNCRESDDEDDELHCEVSDLDENEDEEEYDAEYSEDEYYSKQVPEIPSRSCSSMDSGTESSRTCDSKKDQQSLDKEIITPPGFHRGARDRAGYVHSVLNPVENTAQWKNLKTKRTPPLKRQKENFPMDLGFEQSSSKSKSIPDGPDNEYGVAVDASLSTWLDSSQKTPSTKSIPIGLEHISSPASMSSHGSNSVRNLEERPILGALTMDELKQFSASSSPRRSPSRSPNEKPLVGTVGIHWNDGDDRTPVEGYSSASSFKGIPNTTSKYREDKSVKWHSTPFETRLERALKQGATDSRT
ncbi:uncharacterized protein LOC141604040 isoform X2 [Silene latifolia]|uniref:uncharacterized protein LOC141604040 isoform X2 n=1 Tax=Silene latifolia TaxID=37657 RepID=UPI003D76EA3E